MTPESSPPGSNAGSPRRPKLQNRAITDVGPLSSPSRRDARDLGQGTRPRVAAANLTSGSTLPDGRSMPVSPFLPLPPAPTSEEISALHQQDLDDDNQTPTLRSASNASLLLQRATSGQRDPRRAVSNKVTKNPRASGMIRSYSTPVATQSQFEEERRTFAQQSSQNSRSYVFSNGWPTARSRFPAMTPFSSITTSNNTFQGGDDVDKVKVKTGSSAQKGDRNGYDSSPSPTLQFGTFFGQKKPTRKPLSPAPSSQNLKVPLHPRSGEGSSLAASPSALTDDIDSAMDLDSAEQNIPASYFVPRSSLRPTMSANRTLTQSSTSSDEGPITPIAPTPSIGLTRLGSQMKHTPSQQRHQHGGQIMDEGCNPFLDPAHNFDSLTSRRSTMIPDCPISVGGDDGEEMEEEEDDGGGSLTSTEDVLEGAFFIHEEHLQPPPSVVIQGQTA